MSSITEKIKARYFRRVIAYPQGAIVHCGDCLIYSHKRICTCGLHHDLIPLSNESIEELYPKFWEEYKV